MEIRVVLECAAYPPSCLWEPAPLVLVLLLCFQGLCREVLGAAGCAWLWQICSFSFHEVWHFSPSGTEGLQHFKGIDQFSEGITHHCCRILPKILEQGGSKSFTGSLC